MKLSTLRSIGEKREKDFNKMGIFEVEDLVRFYPRAYLDLTERASIKTVYHNDMALVACQVNRVMPVNYGNKRKMVKAFCSQDGFPFTVVWFNQPYVAQKLKAGEYLFYGRVQNKFGQISLVNPTFEEMDKNYRLKGIVPVYSLKGALSQKVVRAAVKEAMQKCDLQSVIPWQIIRKYDLPDLVRAYYEVHNPTSHENKDVASERIALEEYFTLISAFKIIKGGKEEARLHNYTVTASEVKEFSRRFGFEFTDGQKRAVNEIFENLYSPTRMNRLVQGDVEIPKLSFIVCDEQHRFGVAQRNALAEKGVGTDMLVMSATPIPRTLSLIFYGDLDVTTITDKPSIRQEISTGIIPESKYDDMLDYVQKETAAGKQAYMVCAKIEDDEEGSIMSVTELYEELKGRLPSVRFGLLHGKMKEKEKTEVMTAFKNREYDCLVSTTVIEVGVDVPNATIMIIYNAERFGLSQLHQLRGRVGRGAEKSYCFLLQGAESETAKERLLTLKNNTDGFKIAEKDLEMRGSGDFFGTRQSGKVLTDIKNLRYPTSVIFTAKKMSDDAFAMGLADERVRDAAIRKYESLKDVVLN